MPPSAIAETVEAYWQGLLAAHPLVGTLTGDERFDDLMPDLSERSRAASEVLHRGALDAIARFDPDRLDEAERLDAAVVVTIATRELEALERAFARFDAGSQMGDAWVVCPGTLLTLLASIQRPRTPEGIAAYVRRLRAVPRFLDQCAELLREADRAGGGQPRIVLERTLGQVRRILTTPAAESPALRPVPMEAEASRAEVVEALQIVVLPAYGRLADQLALSAERARKEPGLCGLRGGEDLYRAHVRYWLSLDLAPDRLHERGRSDLTAVASEQAETARKLGYGSPAKATQAYLHEHRGPGTRDELLADARELVDRSWSASKEIASRLPTANCTVELVDPSREADVLGYYEPAAEGRPAVFFASGADVDSRPMHRLAAWVAHEANPGHHLQIALEREDTERSAFRRFTNDFASSAFVEGWGLYAERLGDEIGLYRDEFDRLGMLDQQAFRCARLVVDTGIHAFGWSRERAIETLVEAGSPRTEAEIEADRYAADPGQALTYRVGQLAIEACRKRLVEPGDRDALVRYHDRVLKLGSLPLSTLERELTGGEFQLL
jgi:uncharacterized protein (DUF885 family)